MRLVSCNVVARRHERLVYIVIRYPSVGRWVVVMVYFIFILAVFMPYVLLYMYLNKWVNNSTVVDLYQENIHARSSL